MPPTPGPEQGASGDGEVAFAGKGIAFKAPKSVIITLLSLAASVFTGGVIVGNGGLQPWTPRELGQQINTHLEATDKALVAERAERVVKDETSERDRQEMRIEIALLKEQMAAMKETVAKMSGFLLEPPSGRVRRP